MPKGMNLQGRFLNGVWSGGIEWTRLRLLNGVVLPGYTWNVVGGCLHECKWQMPDGSLAICYAKGVAERLAQKTYNQGFAHHYWNPEILQSPKKLRQRSGIFLDSMSDLFGHWVPDDQIKAVLDVAANTEHVYFALTKNTPRLLKFQESIPANVWLGASMPPDMFLGQTLTSQQQRKMLERSLSVLSELSETHITWMSFEPLSWDVSDIVARYKKALKWSVIGAASNGSRVHDPDLIHVQKLLKELECPTFFKGNLRPLVERHGMEWREEFATPLDVAA